MNHWQIDMMAEIQRQRILEEMKNIRLEEKAAATSRSYHPSLYERMMYRLANWLIAAGQQLRRRYEIPALRCNPSATNDLARWQA